MESGVTNIHLKSMLEKHELQNATIGKHVGKDKGNLQNDEFDATLLEPCTLWDKPVSEFKLEYVDLDEFLTENGIPVEENVVQKKRNGTSPAEVSLPEKTTKVSSSCSLDSEPQVGTKLDCKLSTDLVLEAVPEVQDFDPSSHAFLDEELKPQSIGKKSSKQFVPEEFKDEKYWARRRKNNLAAKRSREARRMKENQIVLRASYLEKENIALREEIKKLIEENHILQNKVKRLENN